MAKKIANITPELVCQVLDPIAEGADVGDHYWVHGGNEALSYCEDCIRKAVADTMRRTRDRTVCVDGGSDWPEEDTPASCQACGRLVGYVLLDEGVEAELDHFEMYPPSWPPSSREAFELLQIFIEMGDWLGTHGTRAKGLGCRLLMDSVIANG